MIVKAIRMLMSVPPEIRALIVDVISDIIAGDEISARNRAHNAAVARAAKLILRGK